MLKICKVNAWQAQQLMNIMKGFQQEMLTIRRLASPNKMYSIPYHTDVRSAQVELEDTVAILVYNWKLDAKALGCTFTTSNTEKVVQRRKSRSTKEYLICLRTQTKIQSCRLYKFPHRE